MHQVFDLAFAVVLTAALAGVVRADDKPAEQAARPAEAKAGETSVKGGKPAKVDAGINADAFAAPINRLLTGKLVVRKPADDPNAAMTKQYATQMRHMLISELNFVRQMCDQLTVAQRTEIRKAGEEALLESARAVARQRQPQVNVLGGFGRTAATEPRQRIRDAVEGAVVKVLDEASRKAFQEEVAKRAEFRRRAAISYLVARMDRTLYLTPEQRKKITESLTENWQDAWESWTLLQSYGDQYFPVIPDQYVTPALKPEQVSVLRGLQRISVSSWSNRHGNQIEDDGWWGAGLQGQGANGADGAIFFEDAAF